MDIYYLLTERLTTIRFLYENAAKPFLENMRKIDAEEEPYDAPPAAYDMESGEPAFLEEYDMNRTGLTFLGHACIAMLQVSLKLYLDAYKTEVERYHGKQDWSPSNKRKLRGDNWFTHYKLAFLEVLGIDWIDFGEHELTILEQITLARDDILHPPKIWTRQTYQSKQHFAKYTESFFASEFDLEIYRRTGRLLGDTWALDVTPEKMREAIELVDSFCQFMEDKGQSWRKR